MKEVYSNAFVAKDAASRGKEKQEEYEAAKSC
jgi:hypothetical protein